MSRELTKNKLERNGCPIHYWTGGKAEAPLVVFTHGATFGILSGLYLGYVIVRALWTLFPMQCSSPLSGVLAGIAIGLLFRALAAVIPGRQAARLQVVEALRYK